MKKEIDEGFCFDIFVDKIEDALRGSFAPRSGQSDGERGRAIRYVN